MSELEPFEDGSSHQNALLSNIPKIYTNGFTLGLSNADCNLVLSRNSEPQAIINLSYTTAKTLAVSLIQLISSLESATGRDMMTVDIVQEALSKAGMEEVK